MDAAAPGAQCGDMPGRVVPLIDRNRCEAKGACVEACPYDVFEIRALGPEELASLSLLGKLKAWAHGGKQAFAVHADACHACGLCVQACPEQAIRLGTAGPG
jgi:4Fe-4S ferredoxin